MASVSLLQLLDEAIGTPEVNVNLEALRKLLRVILGHLSLLGLQDVIPQEAVPGPQEEGGGSSTQAGARGTGQPPQQPGEQPPRGRLPGKDELQGTRSGPPVTSVAADMGQMEKTEAKESGISKVEAFPTPLGAPPEMPPPLGSVPLYQGLVEAQAPSSMLSFIVGKGGRCRGKIWG